jgi:hypothetical protein
MDVIASTSFGIEVDSQKDPNNKFVHYAKMAALGDIKKPSILLASKTFTYMSGLGIMGGTYSTEHAKFPKYIHDRHPTDQYGVSPFSELIYFYSISVYVLAILCCAQLHKKIFVAAQ